MAGSGFPPLTNIPYCCLPQESGPCLSTSVGDRPLRSPSHRSLGGPSPRQPANGTHARPRPRRRFALLGMPQLGFMPYYPAFPPAIRPTGVGCIRVTHPSATLATPKGRLPSDLHVLGLPLAFILSQDQTLRCTIVFANCSSLCLGFRLTPPRSRAAAVPFPYPSGIPHGMPLVLASDFQRSVAPGSPSASLLLPVRKRVQKYSFFLYAQCFFSSFFHLFRNRLCHRKKNLIEQQISLDSDTLLI